MNNLVFHIGYHKTATTWLQTGYFSEHPEITLVANFREPWHDEFLSYLIQTPEKIFSIPQCQNIFKKQMSSLNINAHNVLVTSAERLSGHPFSGGYDSYKLANRMHSCFPNARILIGIRNQMDIIFSVYKQLIQEGYLGTFEDLINSKQWKSVAFSLEMYKYELLIARYFELFSKKNVLILAYEDLLKNKIEYIKRISNFLNIIYFESSNFNHITNKGIREDEIATTLFLNHFRKTELNPFPLFQLSSKAIERLRKITTVFPHKKTIINDHKEFIKQYYAPSNASLRKLLEMKLDGYP